MTKLRYFWLIVIAPALLMSCGEERQRPVFEYTFTNPADIGSRYPNLYTDNTGMIYMSWIMGIEEDVNAMQYSRFKDGQWYEPQTVQVGTDFFINWADFPSVVGRDGSARAAHWLKKIEGGPYAYHVQVSLPDEEGRRWEHITPHLDGTATEHGFVSMEPLPNGNTLAIWLDGRETEGREHHEYDDFSKSMTLRSAEITPDGEILRSRVIDDAVCDCCQTDLTLNGDEVLAVYRDRSEEEIRDTYLSTYNIESGEWSTPAAVHDDGWEIRACPVNGPRVAASGDRVAVAWFTGADETSQVKLALSADGGESFGEPVIIADGNNLGRADLLLTDEGSVYVSWLANNNNLGEVTLRKVSPDGSMSDPFRVGVTDVSRSSGFPRMADAGEFILVAWTQTEPNRKVRTARVPYVQ